MVKVFSIAIIKKYVGISAIKASAEVKNLLQTVSNPRRDVESVRSIPLRQLQWRLQNPKAALLNGAIYDAITG